MPATNPDLSATFISDLRFFLHEFFEASLEEVPCDDTSEREYGVPEAVIPMALYVTREPFIDHGPEAGHRIRAKATLPREARTLQARAGRDANLCATLGYLGHDAGVVGFHGAILPASARALAAVTAVALMHAGPSTLEALKRTAKTTFADRLRRRFTGGRTAAPACAGQSTWSEADFERLDFDHAHLCTAVRQDRGWTLPIADSILTLTAVDDHPYFGGGLLSRLWTPYSALVAGGLPITAQQLQAVACVAGDTADFGAWLDEAEGCCFQSFLPNILQTIPDFDTCWVDWSMRRATAAGHSARSYRILAANGFLP